MRSKIRPPKGKLDVFSELRNEIIRRNSIVVRFDVFGSGFCIVINSML